MRLIGSDIRKIIFPVEYPDLHILLKIMYPALKIYAFRIKRDSLYIMGRYEEKIKYMSLARYMMEEDVAKCMLKIYDKKIVVKLILAQ